MDLRLQDAAAGETIAVVSEKGTQADLDGVVTRAGARLREKLGLAAVSATEAVAVRASLPANPEAARLYAEGLAKLRLFEDDAARVLLEKAVAADPRHAAPAHSASPRRGRASATTRRRWPRRRRPSTSRPSSATRRAC